MALILDGTTGIGIDSGTQPLDPASLNAVTQALIPTGTKMLFQQTAAPTGWTKDTSHDNKALRVVSGTASTGGSVEFTTAFASQAVSGTVGNTTATNIATTATNIATTQGGTVNDTTLTTTQMPSHGHNIRHVLGGTATAVCIHAGGGNRADGNGQAAAAVNTGGSGAHNHSFTGSSHNHTQNSHNHTQNAHNHSFTGTAINLAVSYVDLIIATKD